MMLWQLASEVRLHPVPDQTLVEFSRNDAQLIQTPYNSALLEKWYRFVPDENKLDFIKKHIKGHPKDSLIYQDYLTRLSWNEEHGLVSRLYQSIKFTRPQIYLLRAVAKSARESNNSKLAVELYTKILHTIPGDLDAQIGQFELLLLNKQAGSVINNYLSLPLSIQKATRIQRLLAQAHQQVKQAPYASLILQKLLSESPDDPILIQEHALAMIESGMPTMAYQIYQNNPNTFTPSNTQQTLSAYNTYQTRIAINEEQPLQQLTLARQALANNLTYIHFLQDLNSKQSLAALPAAHADRLTLLSLSNDHLKIVQYFNETKDVELPNYGKNMVAGSMLGLKKPHQALKLIDSVLDHSPNNHEALLLAYFAHLESENFLQAEEQLNKLSQFTPIWLYSTNPNIVRPNRKKAAVDLMQAVHLAYKNHRSESLQALNELLKIAPGNDEYWANLAAINRWGGWLNKSQQILNVIHHADPVYSQKTVEEIYLYLAQRKYKQAINLHEKFKTSQPNHDALPQLTKELSLYNSNQLSVSVLDNTSKGTRFSGREDAFDINFYSQPISYNWRLLAAKQHRHAMINDTQKSTINQYKLGVEYRWQHIAAQLQYKTTENHTGSDWQFNFDYKINDNWMVGVGSQTFSDETPLRAFAQGITASSTNLGINHKSEDQHQHGL